MLRSPSSSSWCCARRNNVPFGAKRGSQKDLMAPLMENDSSQAGDSMAINVATLVASILSLIGSSTILLSYLLYSRGTLHISKMILFLALADLGWAITEIFAFSIILHNSSHYNAGICKAARGVFQFFSSAAVMWSMCICIYLFRSVVIAREPNSDNIILGTKKPRKTMIIYHSISWGVPIIQCLVIFLPNHSNNLEQLKHQHICIPKEPWLGLAWFLPIGLAIFLSAALYTIFINRIFRITRSTGAAATQQLPLRLASYVLVLFICWAPNVVAYLILQKSQASYKDPIMAVVNGLLELQGALDCIVYGFTNREFRANFTRKTALFRVFLAPVILPFAAVFALYRKCTGSESYSPLLERHGRGESREYRRLMSGSSG